MDVKKVYQDGAVTKYLVKGTTSSFMNSIRRTIIIHVPCLAVDEVNFYENDSVIFDEMLAGRLGLLPIKTDPKAYKRNDTVKLVLEKTGPGIVTSKEIKCTDPKIEILDKKIYIAKLGKEQKMKLEMTARMSSGKEHARFQPAIVSFNELPIIKNEKTISNAKELLEEAPTGSIEVKAGKVFLLDPYNIKIQNQPVDTLEKYGVKVEYEPNEFVLTIETTGQLEEKEIIESALNELSEKFSELDKEIKKL